MPVAVILTYLLDLPPATWPHSLAPRIQLQSGWLPGTAVSLMVSEPGAEATPSQSAPPLEWETSGPPGVFVGPSQTVLSRSTWNMPLQPKCAHGN